LENNEAGTLGLSALFHDPRIRNLVAWPQRDKPVSPGQSSVDIGHLALPSPISNIGRWHASWRDRTSESVGLGANINHFRFSLCRLAMKKRQQDQANDTRLSPCDALANFGFDFSADPAAAGLVMLELRRN
jgi:hypothetical protein